MKKDSIKFLNYQLHMKVSFLKVIPNSALLWEYNPESNTAEYIFKTESDLLKVVTPRAAIVDAMRQINGIRLEDSRAVIDDVKEFIKTYPMLEVPIQQSVPEKTGKASDIEKTNLPGFSMFKRNTSTRIQGSKATKTQRASLSLENYSENRERTKSQIADTSSEDSRHSVQLPIMRQSSPLKPLDAAALSGKASYIPGSFNIDTIIPKERSPEAWRQTLVFLDALGEKTTKDKQKSAMQLLRDEQDIIKELHLVEMTKLYEIKGSLIRKLKKFLDIIENALQQVDPKYPFPATIFSYFQRAIVEAMVNTEENLKAYGEINARTSKSKSEAARFIKRQAEKSELVMGRLLAFHYFTSSELTQIQDDNLSLQSFLAQVKIKLKPKRQKLDLLLAGMTQLILESLEYEWMFKKEIERISNECSKHPQQIEIAMLESEKDGQAQCMYSIYALIKGVIAPSELHKKSSSELDRFIFSLMGDLINYVKVQYYCISPFVGNISLKGTWKDEHKDPRDFYIYEDFAVQLRSSLKALVTPLLYSTGKYAFPSEEKRFNSVNDSTEEKLVPFKTLLLNHLIESINKLIKNATDNIVPATSNAGEKTEDTGVYESAEKESSSLAL
ncbi:hypothetical protein [Legionella genomosp. 1]|uniref:hypothetical protein n=1 Tax=Legionella genomosp. 1 TaxID=1093625 RepID=UPI00105554A5|nr:hypothetical protein [Legionella genomosp. 1]